MITLCIGILLLLVTQNTAVIEGARYGLMLWYQNVLPLLLPFMIMSNLLLLQVKRKESKTCVVYILLLGLLCGYPLGAKTTADFTSERLIDKSLANRLMPLCNNISPMFLCGYIYHIILLKKVKLYILIILIYMPYIFVFFISFFLNKSRITKPITDNSLSNKHKYETNTESILLQATKQITYVGIYIMICSIIVSIIWQFTCISTNIKTCLALITEITQGSSRISSLHMEQRIKTALILGATSFGGISSLFQTYQVTQASGLSMFKYTITKIVCGVMTGLLSYFLLI